MTEGKTKKRRVIDRHVSHISIVYRLISLSDDDECLDP